MARVGKNIYKRKDGRWEARFFISRKPNGKPLYKSVYGKNCTDVKQKRDQALVRALTAQKTQELRRGLLETIAKDWLEFNQSGKKDSTIARYHSLLRLHIIPYWQGRQIKGINAFEMERYVSELLKSGLSPQMASDIVVLLKSIFKYAERTGYAVVCDFKEISVPKGGKPMRVLTCREQRSFTHFLLCRSNDSALGILLTLYTGLRIGELCALKWGDINLKDRIIRVRHTMQRIKNLSGQGGAKTKVIITEPKSVKSSREIPIPKFLTPFLRKAAAAPNAYILTGSPDRFAEPRALQYRFKKYLRQADAADANFHALRHTFATRAVEQGFDIKSLSEILGHANIQTTLKLYVHPTFEMKRKYMDRLSPKTI